MHAAVAHPVPGEKKSYLEHRSDLAKRLAGGHGIRRVTIIDDQQFDADVVAGLLRRALGRDIEVDIARSMMAVHTLWEASRPDVVFLDDRLGFIGTATTHIPALRKMKFDGPIVVMSGLMTRLRRAELMQLGAAEMLHKDNLDTVSIMEVLLKLLDNGSLPPATA